MGSPDPRGDARAVPADTAAARRILRLIQLAAPDAGSEAVAALCRRAVDAGIAALRLPPRAIEEARRHLGPRPLRLTTAANPGASDDIARAAAEVAEGIAAGADEVEVTAPTQAILDGDVGLVGELVESCLAEADGHPVAVVLDVGALGDAALITAAARAAIMAGADRLVASSERGPPPPEATAALLAVVVEAGGRAGIGIAGFGTVQDAFGQLQLIDQAMEPDWATPTTVRLGGSGRLDGAGRLGGSGLLDDALDAAERGEDPPSAS